jgi:hypothetical protein
VHWGVHQAPRLYGSKVRKRGQVTGLASGLKEAGKVTGDSLAAFVWRHSEDLVYITGPVLWVSLRKVIGGT